MALARVSHFMTNFRRLGFIDYNGHLEVHSSLLSVVLAEQPRSVDGIVTSLGLSAVTSGR